MRKAVLLLASMLVSVPAFARGPAQKTEAAATATVPAVKAALTPGIYKYRATLIMGSRSMTIESQTEIKAQGGTWIATDRLKTPMGETADTVVLDKKTLALIKRHVTQGPISVELAVKGTQATGKLTMNGKEQPLNVDLGGPLFADGAGAAFAVAALPLKEGYATTFRNLDLLHQKVKLLRLKVAGVDKVTVPAGTFDAYRVDIVPADGGPDRMTLWVAKGSNKPVKMTAVAANMGGSLTAELVK